MNDLANVDPLLVCGRVLHIFIASFIYLYIIAKFVGPDNKQRWFRKRKKYTFFNRRGVFGEDINFGYPVTWQGVGIFFLIYGVIFSLGYWYIFVHAY